MLKIIRNFLNGLAFGITETIPGVSGGTIAIILGFYFELIETVNHLTKNFSKRIPFVFPLLIGLLTGVLLFSSVIHYLLTWYSFPTMLFFIGLITGIIPHIFAKVHDKGHSFKFWEILLIVLPFALLVTLSFLKNASVASPEDLIQNIDFPFMMFILFAGILAAAALVMPGISGSFVLLLLGIYHLAIFSIKSIGGIMTGTGIVSMLDICKVLVPLVIGIIIGGLCMARLIESLLKKYHTVVYSVILGLLSGSVFFLFRNPMVYQSGFSTLIIIIGIATFLLGCVLSFFLGRKRL